MEEELKKLANEKVFEIFRTLSGKKLDKTSATAMSIHKSGKDIGRAMADSLELYGLGGSVDDRKNTSSRPGNNRSRKRKAHDKRDRSTVLR